MSKKNLAIFSLFFSIMTSVFCFDVLGVRKTEGSIFFDFESDRLIISRMAYSDKHGVFSGGGLLMTVVADKESSEKILIDNNFKEFALNNNFTTFYKSQSGFSGFVLSIISKLFKYEKLAQLQLTYQAMLAFVLSLFCTLVFVKVSKIIAIFLAMTLISSNILIYASGSLYWFVALYYLPVLPIIYFFNSVDRGSFRLLVVLFFMFLLKFLSGFEHITTVVLMPICTYVILSKQTDLIKLFTVIIKIFLVAMGSFIAALVIWYNQISQVLNLSFQEKVFLMLNVDLNNWLTNE